MSNTWKPPSSGSPGGGSVPSLAQVSLSGLVSPWDGLALHFTTVDHDPDGLWDAVNFMFVAKVAGWYRPTLWGKFSGGVISDSGGANNQAQATVANSGAGDNIAGIASASSSTPSSVSLVDGYTHLDVGDGVFVIGTGNNTLEAAAGAALSLLLVAAD